MGQLNPLTSSPRSLFIHYAIHTVIGMITMSSAVMIDGLFVGRWIGADALAALNLVWPIIGFTFGLFYMIVIGGCAAIGNLLGAGLKEKANKLFTQIFIVILIASAIGSLTGLFLQKPIIILLKVPLPLRVDAQRYFAIVMGLIFLFGLNVFFSYSCRLAGHPKLYGAVMATSALLNIILDALFIIVLDWGIVGAALATGLCQGGGVLIGFIVILKDDFPLRLSKPNLPLKDLFKAISNGVSEFFSEISYSLQALILNSILITAYGAVGVTSYVILGYVINLAAMTFFGFAEAAQPLMSQNNGANKTDRVRYFVKLAVLSSITVGILLAIGILLFHTPWAKIFISSEDPLYNQVISLSGEFVQFLWPIFIFMGVGICISSYFTSVESAALSATISLMRLLVFPVLYLVILTNIAPPPWFILAFPLSEMSASILGYALWKKHPPESYGFKKKYSTN